MHYEEQRNEYTISTDVSRLDTDVICRYLSEESYWAKGRPREVVERSIRNSLSFGLYKGERMIGFCRVVTDYATFAWLADVFVLEEFQGQKLGEWMVETVVKHPDLQGLRRWLLATRDAHGLYSKYGFGPMEDPSIFMVRAEKS